MCSGGDGFGERTAGDAGGDGGWLPSPPSSEDRYFERAGILLESMKIVQKKEDKY